MSPARLRQVTGLEAGQADDPVLLGIVGLGVDDDDAQPDRLKSRILAPCQSQAVVAPFFMLDYADRKLVDPRRGAHSRLSFALQLGMGGFLGTFMEDPLEVPWEVVECLADQLGGA